MVTLYINGTLTLFQSPIYADDSSGVLLPNPFTTADGNISFYLDVSQRLDLGIAPPGSPQVLFKDIDVEVPVTSASNPAFISGSRITNSDFLGTGYQLTPAGFFFYEGGP